MSFWPRTWHMSAQLPLQLGPILLCTPHLGPAPSGIMPETGFVSAPRSVQAVHPAQDVLGRDPMPHPRTPSRQAFPDLSASPTQGPPACITAKLAFPSHSDCVGYTFPRLVFLRVGRNSCTTAFNPENRGVGGKRGMCLEVGGISCFRPPGIPSSPLHRRHRPLLSCCPCRSSTDFSNNWEADLISPEGNPEGRKQKWPEPRVTWRMSPSLSGSQCLYL